MPAHTLGQTTAAAPGGGMHPSLNWWRRLRDFLSRRASALGGGLFSMRLGSGQHVQLHDAAGWTVVCRSGSLWITQEADVSDVFLEPGEGFRLDRRGLAVLCARRDTVLSLRPPARSGVRAKLVECGEPEAFAPRGGADVAWLKALYPESGPWNDPAAYRRSGLL